MMIRHSFLIFVGLGVLGFGVAYGAGLSDPTAIQVDPYSSCAARVTWDWEGALDANFSFTIQRAEEPDFSEGAIFSTAPDTPFADDCVQDGRVGHCSYTDRGERGRQIRPGDAFYYQVCVQAGLEGGQSCSLYVDGASRPQKVGFPSIPRPASPTSVLAQWNAAKDSIKVFWTGAVSNAAGKFEVWRATDGGASQRVGFDLATRMASADAPAGRYDFTDPGLDPTHSYTYSIVAVNTDAECDPSLNSSYSKSSPAASSVVPPPTFPPPIPQSLQAQSLPGNVVRLSWEYSSSFSGDFEFKITTRGTLDDPDFSHGLSDIYKRIGDPGVTATSLGGGRSSISFEQNFLPNFRYFFTMCARRNASAVCGPSSENASDYVSPAVPAETGVATPTALKLNVVGVSVSEGVGDVGVRWADNSSIERGYYVWRSESAGGSFVEACGGGLITADPAGGKCLDSGLPADRGYFYKVQGEGSAGTSNFSEIVSVDLNVSPLRGWAWANAGASQGNRLGVGWVSLSSKNPEAGTGEPYGVFANKVTGELSGYAWSGIQCTDGRERCGYGWLSFNKDELLGCPDGNCEAKLDVTTKGLYGWAKFLAADPSKTLWTGWLSLRTKNVEINGRRDNLSYGVCFGTSEGNGTSCAGDGTFDATELDEKVVWMENGVQVPAGTLSGWAWGDNIGGWMQFIGLGSGKPREPVCTRDTDCPAGQICESGRCVSEVTACTRDADCSGERVCKEGQCVVPCSSDADCSPGEKCGVGGFCIPSGIVRPECVITSSPTIQPVSRTIPFSESVTLQVNIPLGCSRDALEWSVGRIDAGNPADPSDDVFVEDPAYGSVDPSGRYVAPATLPPREPSLPFTAAVKIEVPGTPFSDTETIRIGDYAPQAQARCDVTTDPSRPQVLVQWSGAPRVLHDIEILRASSESGPFTSLPILRDQASPTGGRTDAAVVLHGEYYYKVRVFDIAGRAGDIVTNSSRTVCEPPTVAPTNVRVFTQDEKTLYVNWTDNDTRAGHTFTLERIRVTPAVPTFEGVGVAAEPLGDSGIRLTWTNATNWTPYTHIIQRTTTANAATRFTRSDPSLQEFGKDRGAPSRAPTKGVSPRTLSFADSSLAEGTTYYYQVSSCSDSEVPLKGAGWSKYKPLASDVNPDNQVDQPNPACSQFSDIVSATTLLKAPSGLSASARSSSEIQLGWIDNSSQEDGYEIFRDGASLVTVSSNSWNDTGREADTSYTYKVRAFKNVSGGRIYSEFSPTVGARTERAAAPFQVTLQIAGVGGGSILPNSDPTITCSKVAGASALTCGPFDPPGSSIVFTASPNPGSVFGAWSGCTTLSGDTPPTCTVIGTATVVARFDAVGALRGADKLYASVFEILKGRLGGLSAFVRKTASPLFEEVEMSEVASLKLPRSVSGQGKFHVYGGEGFANVWHSFTSFLLKGKDTLISLLSPEPILAQSAVDYKQYFDEVAGGFTQAVYRDERDRTYTEWSGLAPDTVYLYRVKSCLGVSCTAWSGEAAGKTLFYVPGGAPVVQPTDPGGSRVPRPVCTRNSFCDYSLFSTVSPRNPATGRVEESEQQCRVNADCASVGRSERSFGER